MDNIQLLEKLQADKKKLFQEIAKVIIGQKEIVEHLFVSLLCRGHILLEGVPGLAKTLLIKTLADAMDLARGRPLQTFWCPPQTGAWNHERQQCPQQRPLQSQRDARAACNRRGRGCPAVAAGPAGRVSRPLPHPPATATTSS